MAKVNLSEDMKPKIMVARNIFMKDAAFILCFPCMLYLFFSDTFDGALMWIFVLFSMVVAIWIISKCPLNPTRRNYQALILYLTKNSDVYRPLSKGDFDDNADKYNSTEITFKFGKRRKTWKNNSKRVTKGKI